MAIFSRISNFCLDSLELVDAIPDDGGAKRFVVSSIEPSENSWYLKFLHPHHTVSRQVVWN
jgi:hypothetical protein